MSSGTSSTVRDFYRPPGAFMPMPQRLASGDHGGATRARQGGPSLSQRLRSSGFATKGASVPLGIACCMAVLIIILSSEAQLRACEPVLAVIMEVGFWASFGALTYTLFATPVLIPRRRLAIAPLGARPVAEDRAAAEPATDARSSTGGEHDTRGRASSVETEPRGVPSLDTDRHLTQRRRCQQLGQRPTRQQPFISGKGGSRQQGRSNTGGCGNEEHADPAARDATADLAPPSCSPRGGQRRLPDSPHGLGFAGQVDDLAKQLAVTPETILAVDRLADDVQSIVRSVTPHLAFACIILSEPSFKSPYAAAVPEVCFVAMAPRHLLVNALRKRWLGEDPPEPPDNHSLSKSVLRQCTDRLVAAGFKFKRSAFRCEEPYVTLSAPPGRCACAKSVPFAMMVNATFPFEDAIILGFFKKVKPVAEALTMVVKCWAKDRGISHAPSGHLQPLAWTLLVVFFLQVRHGRAGDTLPPLQGFPLPPSMLNRDGVTAAVARLCRLSGFTVRRDSHEDSSPEYGARSVGALFAEFLHFFASQFDWGHEVVSVRIGSRTTARGAILTVREGGSPDDAELIIEDPFKPTSNVGSSLTRSGLGRVQDEFKRADSLCQNGADLRDLLDPWCSPA